MPSRILCGSWARCDERGYDSYGYGSVEDQSFWRMSPGDECTNYVAYVESRVYHVATPSYLLGNAGQWPYTAAAHGVVVNDTPSVGAVAVWAPGTFGIGADGHVAVVEEVGPGDKYIVISQQHMGYPHDYNWTLIKNHYPADEWQEWPSSFIHFPIPRRADVGFYNRKTGHFAERYSQSAGPANRSGTLGASGAVPLAGQWLSSGDDGTGYYTPKYSMFHLLGAGTSKHPNVTIKFGTPGVVPLVGNWLGWRKDGIGYYERASGTFVLRQSLTPGRPMTSFTFGPPHMDPLVGDWNGKGRDGVGYYNPDRGTFSLRVTLSSGPAWVRFKFGPPHMDPIIGNWTGHGSKDGVGYYDPQNGTFFLRDTLSAGPANIVAQFGPAQMTPLTGEWYGV